LAIYFRSISKRVSPRAGIILNITIIITVVLAILLTKYPIADNILYTSRPIAHLGTVKNDTVAKTSFVLTNVHPWPVTVVSVLTSCGCTHAIPARQTPFRLYPLESFKVTVGISTIQKSGPMEEDAYVITSDRPSGTKLTLLGNVVPAVAQQNTLSNPIPPVVSLVRRP
jgi:hypothetical protein